MATLASRNSGQMVVYIVIKNLDLRIPHAEGFTAFVRVFSND